MLYHEELTFTPTHSTHTGGDKSDTRNFDREFTKLPLKDSMSNNGQHPGQATTMYPGFSFTERVEAMSEVG